MKTASGTGILIFSPGPVRERHHLHFGATPIPLPVDRGRTGFWNSGVSNLPASGDRKPHDSDFVRIPQGVGVFDPGFLFT